MAASPVKIKFLSNPMKSNKCHCEDPIMVFSQWLQCVCPPTHKKVGNTCVEDKTLIDGTFWNIFSNKKSKTISKKFQAQILLVIFTIWQTMIVSLPKMSVWHWIHLHHQFLSSNWLKSKSITVQMSKVLSASEEANMLKVWYKYNLKNSISTNSF